MACIHNKSVRGRVEWLRIHCCITDILTKFRPVYFWINFKREQEIAVESMLMNKDILVMLPAPNGKS